MWKCLTVCGFIYSDVLQHTWLSSARVRGQSDGWSRQQCRPLGLWPRLQAHWQKYGRVQENRVGFSGLGLVFARLSRCPIHSFIYLIFPWVCVTRVTYNTLLCFNLGWQQSKLCFLVFNTGADWKMFILIFLFTSAGEVTKTAQRGLYKVLSVTRNLFLNH